MKVLHVIETLGRGGAERVLATLARAMRNRVELHVLALVGRGPIEADLRLAGARVYSLDLQRVTDVPSALPRLAKVIHDLRPDVVHTHLRYAELYCAAVPLPKGTRLVATFHNMGFDAATLSKTDRAVRAAERAVLKHRFARFFAVSEQSALSYQRHLALDAVEVIHNPVDIDRVRRFASFPACAAEARTLRARGHKLVVQVGSFREVKGHRVMLEAMRRSERFVWVAVGDGPLREELEQAVTANGLGARTCFPGELNHDDTLGWISQADVVAQPSFSEGIPVTLIESMALGRPVLASDVGGIPELIQHDENGLLAPAGNADALVRGMHMLFDDTRRAEALTARARHDVETRFDAPAIAQRWQEAYARVR